MRPALRYRCGRISTAPIEDWETPPFAVRSTSHSRRTTRRLRFVRCSYEISADAGSRSPRGSTCRSPAIGETRDLPCARRVMLVAGASRQS